jgi:flagellar biosynthesis protein FlhA
MMQNQGFRARLSGLTGANLGEMAVIAGVIFVIGLLIIPLPSYILDLFLAISIASSVLVLLVAMYVEKPLEFSAFPSVLLLLTLYRLSLNVSSTRLILGEGKAGGVIDSFGKFVVGGNYAVGVIIFLILVAINFIVITKGAGRVAEVAARFTLDAMPGRQMSIDGDLNAGLIDETEAKRRREEIAQEADFFGAMDGSAKFVRGDAIAGLIITGINILAGLFVGVVQNRMTVGAALEQYTILTVGDGLVSQIPALIISVASGLMVTQSSSGGRVAKTVIDQLSYRDKPWYVAGGVLISMALVPGLPFVPFMILGSACVAAGRTLPNREHAKPKAEVETAEEKVAEASPVHDLLQIDPVELEVGYGLISLVNGPGGDLLDRIKLLRKQAAQELGILIPPIRVRDDVRLEANQYVIRVRGSEVGRGEVMPRQVLALDTGGVVSEIAGLETVDPSFGMPARWISPADRVEAEASGYVVVEPSTVLATHLMETLKKNAAELLGRQDVQEMVDTLKEAYPALVDEVVPGKVPLGVLHRVLQRLLEERIPIRDLVTILETLADVSESTKDPEQLTEHVRRALSHVIGEIYIDREGAVRGITLGPRLEAALMGLFSPRASMDGMANLGPEQLTDLLTGLDRINRQAKANGDGPPTPLVTPPALRIGVRRLIEPVLPDVPVVSLAELPSHINLRSVATWELELAA